MSDKPDKTDEGNGGEEEAGVPFDYADAATHGEGEGSSGLTEEFDAASRAPEEPDEPEAAAPDEPEAAAPDEPEAAAPDEPEAPDDEETDGETDGFDVDEDDEDGGTSEFVVAEDDGPRERTSEWVVPEDAGYGGVLDESAEDEPAAEDAEPAAEPAAEDEAPDDDDQPTVVSKAPNLANQETVEADSLALADQEEAREQAERGGEPQEAGEEAGAAATAVQPQQAAAEGAPPQEIPPADRVAGDAGGDGDGETPDEEEFAPRTRLWARFLTASAVIVISMATATAVTVLLYLSDIANGLKGLPSVQKQLSTVRPGGPQTILIIGSDKRATVHTQGLSDTTMLLRLDPDKHAIAVLSLPRDLKVNIPGRGVAKLNEAYTLGGPQLTTRVVKQLTGLKINHVVNVNFDGFAKAVNAIGCVYVDVDRHYFHSNAGLPVSEQYSEINIPAGYQRLCGYQALQYVRYRHTDNDLVRAARQQDFLREARQKVPPSKLFADRRQLIKIFTDYTTSDIDDPETVLELFKTFLYLRAAPVRQIHFKGTLGQSYVTASQSEIKTAVSQFLGLQATPGPRAPTAGGGGKGGKGGGAKPKPKPAPAAPVPLIDATGAAQPFVAATEKRDTLPIYYPTKLAPSSVYDDQSRPAYKILNPDGSFKYQAYKYVFSRPSPSVVTEYYGFQGTSWTDPPILDDPDQTKSVGSRDYLQFFDADRLRLVGWKTSKGSYWVSNTLGETLSTPQMMAIAQSVRLANPPKKKKKK